MAPLLKVFKYELVGQAFVLIPQGNTSSFRYRDIHVDSNAILSVLDSPDVTRMVIDLSAVSHVSSVVIGALVRMAQKVSQRGGKVILCAASPDIEEVLSTMNLNKLWPICVSREQAIAALDE